METKEYVYLWVLDFNDGQVYKYAIDKAVYNEEPDCCEDYDLKHGDILPHQTFEIDHALNKINEVLNEFIKQNR